MRLSPGEFNSINKLALPLEAKRRAILPDRPESCRPLYWERQRSLREAKRPDSTRYSLTGPETVTECRTPHRLQGFGLFFGVLKDTLGTLLSSCGYFSSFLGAYGFH